MDYAMISSVWIYIYHNKGLSIRVYKKNRSFYQDVEQIML